MLALTATPAQAATHVTGLETNATASPLGIDDATPQLRWRLESDQRAVMQTELPRRGRDDGGEGRRGPG